jgi:DNA-binding XRE family transcriptional regulator
MTAQNLPIFAGFALLALILIGAVLVWVAVKTKRKPPVPDESYSRNKSLLLFAQRLRATRIKDQVTQAEIAKRIGVKTCTISALENGSFVPTYGFLWRVARALDITLKIEVDR